MVIVFIGGCNYKPENDNSNISSNNETSVHLWHDISATDSVGNINVLIEIPAGSTHKYELDKLDGILKWEVIENGENRIINYLAYPVNYGMIPQTYLPKSAGGDGDPLDVIVLGNAIERGSIVQCKLIGILQLKDRGEADDKLIAVQKSSVFSEVSNIDELDDEFPGVCEILYIWFTNYKGEGMLESNGFYDVDSALKVLDISIEAYKEEFKK